MMIGAAPAGMLYELARWLPFAVAGTLELTMAAIVWFVLRRAPACESVSSLSRVSTGAHTGC
jgi:hypothetical protein